MQTLPCYQQRTFRDHEKKVKNVVFIECYQLGAVLIFRRQWSTQLDYQTVFVSATSLANNVHLQKEFTMKQTMRAKKIMIILEGNVTWLQKISYAERSAVNSLALATGPTFAKTGFLDFCLSFCKYTSKHWASHDVSPVAGPKNAGLSRLVLVLNPFKQLYFFLQVYRTD
jgi:hypothetical protein